MQIPVFEDKKKGKECTSSIKGGKPTAQVMQKDAGSAAKHTTVHVSESDITSQMQNRVGKRAHGQSVSKQTAPETRGGCSLCPL